MSSRTSSNRAVRRSSVLAGSIALACLVGVETMADDAYGVGDSVAAIELTDQHGEVGSVDGSTKVVLLVRDRFASEILKEAFADIEPQALAERQIAYITDISGLTLLAENLFVVPGMRAKAYSILLDRDPVKTGRYPGKGGQVTVLFLEDLEVKRVEYATTGSEIVELLTLQIANLEGDVSND